MKRKKVLCRLCTGGLYFTMLPPDLLNEIRIYLKDFNIEVYRETIIVDTSDVIDVLKRLRIYYDIVIV